MSTTTNIEGSRSSETSSVSKYFTNRIRDFSAEPLTSSILNTINYFAQSMSIDTNFDPEQLPKLYDLIKQKLLDPKDDKTDINTRSVPDMLAGAISSTQKDRKPTKEEMLQCLVVLQDFVDQDATGVLGDALFKELDDVGRGHEYIIAAMQAYDVLVDSTKTGSNDIDNLDLTLCKGLGYPARTGKIGYLIKNIQQNALNEQDWGIVSKYVNSKTNGSYTYKQFRELIIDHLCKSMGTIGPTFLTDSDILRYSDIESFVKTEYEKPEYSQESFFNYIRIAACSVPASDEFLEDGETRDFDQYIANLLNSGNTDSINFGLRIIFGAGYLTDKPDNIVKRVNAVFGKVSSADVQALRSMPESFDILYDELDHQIDLMNDNAIDRSYMPKAIRRLFEVLGFTSEQAHEVFKRWDPLVLKINLREYERLIESDYVLVSLPNQEEAADNAKTNKKPEIVIKGIDDYNGAFTQRGLDNKAEVYRAKNVSGVIFILTKLLADYKQNKIPVGQIVIGGHGTPRSIRIGIQKDESICIKNGSANVIAKILRRMGSPDIILDSCSTNEPIKDGEENIAHYIARISGCRLFAPVAKASRHLKDSSDRIWHGYGYQDLNSQDEILLDEETGKPYEGPTYYSLTEPLQVDDVDTPQP